MHPVIMRELPADQIREMHPAEDERLARQARRARRRVPSMRPRLPANRTLSYDDPLLDAGPEVGLIVVSSPACPASCMRSASLPSAGAARRRTP